MTMPTSLDELIALYDERGFEHYGEGVDMTTHALQCATHALVAGAPDTLVAAALFHDVGHLVADVQGDLGYDLSRDDDIHEQIGARVLAPIFGPSVAQPVALHVTAKRWRCTTEPDYHSHLSATSQATLTAQGGLLNDSECRRFEAHPGFHNALAVRQWDDLAKDPEARTTTFSELRPLLERLAL